MPQTLKEYLTEPYSAVDTSCLLDDCTTISNFRKSLSEIKGQASFASTMLTKPIHQEPRGYITIDSVLDPESCYQEDGHPEVFVDDLDNFIKKYGDWEVNETDGDNTYNYMAPVEDDLSLNRITIVNPEGRSFESKDLLLISASLSLDPRGNYTEAVIAIFDNDDGEHYDATAFGMVEYTLVDGSFVLGNDPLKDKTIEFSISGTLANDSVHLTLYDPDNEFVEDYEAPADLTESEDITNMVKDALKENDQPTEICNLKYHYLSEQND